MLVRARECLGPASACHDKSEGVRLVCLLAYREKHALAVACHDKSPVFGLPFSFFILLAQEFGLPTLTYFNCIYKIILIRRFLLILSSLKSLNHLEEF